MNVHHLELFYYVARHGGISAAARRIPYGIQQPAISAQILQLEDSLGTTLFHRRPFKLTNAGEALYGFIEPFFTGLPDVAKKLRGGMETRLRIATPETVQREYLPALLKATRKRFHGLNFTLTGGRLETIEKKLLAQEIDLGLASLIGKRPEGVRQRELVLLPMALIVPERCGFTAAENIWKRDRIDMPLISLPNEEPICRLFQQELRRRKVDWYPSLELGSLELVGRYVVEGYGAGLALDVPAARLPGTRLLVLPGFPAVPFGAMWTGNLSPVAHAFISEAEILAKKMAGL
ncbi:MAG TPA: LysR family transcriptional regulator [Verrucomicrobiales bacterium]|jgi:DNA-binding transcriptional LysR family regulator|nr:LysR family transcriptional regulator [Verrucomicrobiales bacterium]